MRISILFLNNLKEVRQELKKIGVDKRGIEIMATKALFRIIKLEGIKREAANILKQEALSLGAEAAVHREVISGKIKETDCLLMGTLEQLKQLCIKLKKQPFGLDEIGKEVRKVI
ncbi:MAG: hypothetical protein J7J51_00285 [Candidatus Omnitrophica bacterium]|nr:hypothetical protein [Candidatus Omnitrophota bacterium]